MVKKFRVRPEVQSFFTPYPIGDMFFEATQSKASECL